MWCAAFLARTYALTASRHSTWGVGIGNALIDSGGPVAPSPVADGRQVAWASDAEPIQQLTCPSPQGRRRQLHVAGPGRDAGNEVSKPAQRPIGRRRLLGSRGDLPVLAHVGHHPWAAYADAETLSRSVDAPADRAAPRLDDLDIRHHRDGQPQRRPRPLLHCRPRDWCLAREDAGQLAQFGHPYLQGLGPGRQGCEGTDVDDVQWQVGAAVGALRTVAAGSAPDARRHREVARSVASIEILRWCRHELIREPQRPGGGTSTSTGPDVLTPVSHFRGPTAHPPRRAGAPRGLRCRDRAAYDRHDLHDQLAGSETIPLRAPHSKGKGM